MIWQDPIDFEAGNHGNKPFSIRIPSLVVTRGKNDRLNFLTAMWFTPTGAEPSRMIVAIQKKTLTYDYLMERGEFIMTAPTDTMMEVVVFAGYISGHDVDKWKAAKLTAVQPSKISVPLIGEAIGNVEYKVVNRIPFDDGMDLFVGEVLATHIRKGAMEGAWRCLGTAGSPRRTRPASTGRRWTRSSVESRWGRPLRRSDGRPRAIPRREGGILCVRISVTEALMTDRSTDDTLKREFQEALFGALGRFPAGATRNDLYIALALVARWRIMHRWVATSETYYKRASRTVCYLSAEFLLGPHLGNNLLNLGLRDEARQAMAELGHDLDAILAQEEEPGLGNGGLGRLAACYMDSPATLQIPTLGYGIRYEFGIFDQEIHDGWQVQVTDQWLKNGNPWEIHRPQIEYSVGFGGRTRTFKSVRIPISCCGPAQCFMAP